MSNPFILVCSPQFYPYLLEVLPRHNAKTNKNNNNNNNNNDNDNDNDNDSDNDIDML